MSLPKFDIPSQGASYMLTRGFKVLPLKPNTKLPLRKNWPVESLTDNEGTVGCYAVAANGEFANFGVHPGASKHFVLDIDAKAGKRGMESLHALEETHGMLPKTFTVKTPTGGLHKYFKGEARNTAGTVGVNLDTRGLNGYVVAPGSVIDGSAYEIIDDSEPADAPQWLLDATQPKAKATLERPAITVLDLSKNIEAAIGYLQIAPVCVDGQGGDAGLYRVFCEVRDWGVSKDVARDLVLEHFNPRCEPPWDIDTETDCKHFDDKLANAYNYAQNTLGAKTDEARMAEAVEDFKNVPLPGIPVEAEIVSLPLKSASAIIGGKIPKRDWIIGGYLLGHFMSITGAPGGTGKSNFEILKALAVATGKPLLGSRVGIVRRGPVVLYNCEDPLDELERRVEAFRRSLGLTLEDVKDLHLVSGRDHSLSVAETDRNGEVVFNHTAINTLIATVKSVGAIVMSVDPLVRTHWLNENDNMAMDKVTQAFQRVSSETGCALSIVHHTNKAALNTKGDSSSQVVFRGAGSLVASARVGHVITTMTNTEAKNLRIPSEKRRYYFKVENAKANLSAPVESAEWYQASGQEIPNGETIGVCAPVDLATRAVTTKKSKELMDRAHEFLNSIVPDGGRMKVTEIAEKAIKAKKKFRFANTNPSRAKDYLMAAIEGRPEYSIVDGENAGGGCVKYLERNAFLN